MKKYLLFFFYFILLSFLGFSQEYSNLWDAHYSYLKIIDVTQGNGKIYAASENAIFTYNPLTSELETITTVDGLSGDFISTLHYSEIYEMILIGYENGLIEVYLETEEDVLTVVDILDKPNIPPDKKRINHFNEYEGVVYISTDYGISVYDLSRLEFGDTYYIGDGGAQIIVNQTAVFNGFIYAACADSSGLRRAPVESNDLIDYQEWFRRYVGNYFAVETVENKLYAVRYNGDIFDISSDGPLVSLYNYQSPIENVTSSDNNLIVTTRNEIFVYDSDFNLIFNENNSEIESLFSSGTMYLEEVYIGTLEKGLNAILLTDLTTVNEIYPEGPIRNNAFSIQADFDNLWVTYGEYSLTYFPRGKRYGISNFRSEEWNNIPYDSLFNAKDLNAISINPFNPGQVFISSFQNGILEINDLEPTELYNESNSGLESLIVPNNPNVISVRVSGTTFDREGKLWSMTSRVQRPLKSFNPNTGNWQAYDFSEIIPDGLRDELGFSDIDIDDNGTKWIGALRSGLIGYNENGNLIKNLFDEPNHNMPSTGVFSVAVDNRNQVWIGTNKGLRVLYNTANFFDDSNVTTFPIIILEDGIPKELLEQQFISDIKVDGSNNKWIATIGAGVFYFSSDGQETIYHFTKDNSPLPSNNITDLSIDSDRGVLYIATDRGLLSFSSGGSKPEDNLESAYIYPNPVRPGFNAVEKKIKIKDISENVNIKITDIEGNLVAEAQSNTNSRYKGFNLEIDGGTAYWNGKNLSGNSVSSGVYLIMLNDLDTLETRVLKLMVVR